MKNEHTFLRDNELVCERCGDRFVPQLPAPIDEFVAVTRAFVDLHQFCKPLTAIDGLLATMPKAEPSDKPLPTASRNTIA